MTTPTAASFTTSSGPFVLADGETLLVSVDGPNELITPTQDPFPGGDFVHVAFAAKDFASIGAAQPAEVAAAINAAMARDAAPGQPPGASAAVVGSTVVVTAAAALASNGGAGPLLQILPQSTALAALGLAAGISYPSPYPPFDPPLSL